MGIVASGAGFEYLPVTLLEDPRMAGDAQLLPGRDQKSPPRPVGLVAEGTRRRFRERRVEFGPRSPALIVAPLAKARLPFPKDLGVAGVVGVVAGGATPFFIRGVGTRPRRLALVTGAALLRRRILQEFWVP